MSCRRLPECFLRPDRLHPSRGQCPRPPLPLLQLQRLGIRIRQRLPSPVYHRRDSVRVFRLFFQRAPIAAAAAQRLTLVPQARPGLDVSRARQSSSSAPFGSLRGENRGSSTGDDQDASQKRMAWAHSMIPAVYGSEVHDVLLGVFATMEDVAGNLLLLQPANSPFSAIGVAREATASGRTVTEVVKTNPTSCWVDSGSIAAGSKRPATPNLCEI